MKLSNLYVAFILALLLIACQDNPYAGTLTSQRPEIADVVGTYKLDQQGIVDSLDARQALAATIRLNGDGTFYVSSIPNLLKSGESKEPNIITATGEWHIDTVGTVDNGWSKRRPHLGIKLSNMPESFSSIGLTDNTPPHKLIIIDDDPTLGRVIIFNKQ